MAEKLPDYRKIFSAMGCWDFSIGEGWQKKFIPRLLEQLERDQDQGLRPQVMQIKEKFGGLRIYCGGHSRETQKLIEALETEADTTCEYCGGPGKHTQKGWLRVICEKCETLQALKSRG